MSHQRVLQAVVTLLALGAAVALVIAAASLLDDYRGSTCGEDFPFCTTSGQRSARLALAAVCGLVVVGLVASVWAIWRGVRRRRAYGVVAFAVVLAGVLLIVDPAQHMAFDQGEDQWFTWRTRPPEPTADGGAIVRRVIVPGVLAPPSGVPLSGFVLSAASRPPA